MWLATHRPKGATAFAASTDAFTAKCAAACTAEVVASPTGPLQTEATLHAVGHPMTSMHASFTAQVEGRGRNMARQGVRTSCLKPHGKEADHAIQDCSCDTSLAAGTCHYYCVPVRRCQWQWAAIPVAGAGGMLSMCGARKLGTPSRPGDRAAGAPSLEPAACYVRGLQWCHQRIGESMQRPLELCRWKDREALPPVGKEYQQRSKRVNDRLPKSGELRAAHIATVHASAGPSTPPGKQREERRGEWKTQRRQVIKVPGGAVLRGCKKTSRKLMAHFQLRAGVHSQLRPPQAPRSSQEASQPAASEPGPSTPPAAKRSKRTKAEPAAEPNKAQGKAAKAKPAPQAGRWLDRDCNAVLNMQRIGESRWRPLELCWWPEQGKLPAKGKEYPGLGYKRLQEKPPKTQPGAAQ
ncbi:hypothetical protein QJQ45_004334 [Haematococcus lacustris]|nr:hypothetical protein QJQ45_004334 [Haematococcus lacustris]